MKIFAIIALAVSAVAHAQSYPGAFAYSQNLTADVPIAAGANTSVGVRDINPTNILVNQYTAPTVQNGTAQQYELFIQGQALLNNTTSNDLTVDIIVTNSGPLCGSPSGAGVDGPGRVLTVTVPAGHFLAVPISVIDWVNAGVSSYAFLQYRNASGPGIVAKANSYLDVEMVPASPMGVANTPNQGPPFQPENCQTLTK